MFSKLNLVWLIGCFLILSSGCGSNQADQPQKTVPTSKKLISREECLARVKQALVKYNKTPGTELQITANGICDRTFNLNP